MRNHPSESERSFANGGLDLIVRSGTIVDGTGAPPVTADIGISEGVIKKIGDFSSVTAADEIDATGLVVTPGIIDVHSHADLTLAIDGRAESALAQGVTTVLVGNCGHGCTPLRDRPEYASAIFGYNRSISHSIGSRPTSTSRNFDRHVLASTSGLLYRWATSA